MGGHDNKDHLDEETGSVTGTADKDYNLIWFIESCLSNALRLQQYIADAERHGDNELADLFRRAQKKSRKGALYRASDSGVPNRLGPPSLLRPSLFRPSLFRPSLFRPSLLSGKDKHEHQRVALVVGVAVILTGIFGLMAPVSISDGDGATIGCGNAVVQDTSAARATERSGHESADHQGFRILYRLRQ